MIKKIRDFLGLTQYDMAVYLTINRSQVNMIERGERDLPHEKNELLIPLSIMIEELDAGTLEEVLNDNEDFREIIAKQKFNRKQYLVLRTNECRYKVSRVERALYTLKEDKLRCMNTWKVIPILKAKTQPGIKYLYLVTKKNATQTLRKTGEDLQLKLETRLVGLKAELEFLEKQQVE